MSKPNRILAIETASEACSIALFEEGELLAHDHRVLGRGHAERLVPMIGTLPDKGKAQRIIVSLGPGSFTGVRIGIASARALGIAWHSEVLGYPTLALVATMAQAGHSAKPVSVAMRGGHGEIFLQNFDSHGLAEDDVVSLVPEAAARAAQHELLAGNMAEQLRAMRGSGHALELLPDARFAVRLPNQLLTRNLTPTYGRAPDAKVSAA